MPEKLNQRQDILKKIIKKKKKAFFAVEGISIKNINDLKLIDDIWKIKISTKRHINYDKVYKMIKKEKNNA